MTSFSLSGMLCSPESAIYIKAVYTLDILAYNIAIKI